MIMSRREDPYLKGLVGIYSIGTRDLLWLHRLKCRRYRLLIWLAEKNLSEVWEINLDHNKM